MYRNWSAHLLKLAWGMISLALIAACGSPSKDSSLTSKPGKEGSVESIKAAPVFEDYNVSPYQGEVHPPEWIRQENGEWRDDLGKLVEPPRVNFAGKYFMEVHGC